MGKVVFDDDGDCARSLLLLTVRFGFFSLRDYDGMTKLSRLGCCRIYYLPT